MRILKLKNWDNPKTEIVKVAVEVLHSGGVIVYPADTAGYSLGASALNQDAVRKIFIIKQRPHNMPMNIVVNSSAMAKKFCSWTQTAQKLAEELLPGGLTLILNKKPVLPDILTASRNTVGIRIPNSPVALQIAQKSKVPFTITTANISGQGLSSFTLEEILDNFAKERTKPDLIIDAGKLPYIVSSTILDLTVSPPIILRQGPVSKEEIEKVLGEKVEVAAPR
ncbi:MAG: threonylcarbamoyl-AMP synthase [Candidatus Cloacimonetes bacterium]|nr:threonylcarbamoyl-AMP synthase [Candidatus Cloacimonadota bacterium]